MNNKKILTIHSEDRDINKWPNPNEFELYLPDNYSNIESINLTNISITNNFYNISQYLFNNYLLYTTSNNLKSILIPDGFYTPEQLAFTLTKLFESKSENIYVIYDKIKNKFLFLSMNNNFYLQFDEFAYSDEVCKDKKFLDPIKISKQYSYWGLGYNLGFEKTSYDFSFNGLIEPPNISTNYVNDFDICLNDPNKIIPDDFIIGSCYFRYSENQIDLNPPNTIYMEIDKHNYCDEITPYQYRSNYLYCNDYNSTINSYFAKIQFLTQDSSIGKQMTSTKNEGYITQGHLNCKNPIEKLTRLKFKFRYHNGDLVNFYNNNFNFTLQFDLKCMP